MDGKRWGREGWDEGVLRVVVQILPDLSVLFKCCFTSPFPSPQEWPPQPSSSHSVTIGYEAQSSLVYDVSHDSSQTNISPYRSANTD